ncbi:hypothetical protein AB1Y20_008841 [Prymnesium parvum]|uniref:General transcription factor IIH subunit n=1 Tax=Prymnesium parvum TaxID=97485 RepID=A0AB34IUL4_PRYPA
MADEEEDEAPPAEYVWEGAFERTWDAVRIGEDGALHGGHALERLGRARRRVHAGVKRGVLRTLFLIVDCSRSARAQEGEMRPSRLAVLQDAAGRFVSRFLEQNPICALSLVAMRDGKAFTLAEPSCNARQHLAELRRLQASGCSGDASLQNALELARDALEAIPTYMSREVLLLSCSLSTCDPGDIHATIAALAKAKVRVSIFSLLAEVFICKRITQQTSGTFGVATTPAHLWELLLGLVAPQPMEEGAMAPSRSLVKVGFPARQRDGAPSLCFLAGKGTQTALLPGGYSCPQCCATQEEIPTQCPVCNLKLVSSAELTKTYHHLFPVAAFDEVLFPLDGDARRPAAERSVCYGCCDALSLAARDGVSVQVGSRCPSCKALFCVSCDDLIHEVLHTCPGCNCPHEPSLE